MGINSVTPIMLSTRNGKKLTIVESNIISTNVFFFPFCIPLDVNLFRSERLAFVLRVQIFPILCVIFYVPIIHVCRK